ncbi:glycosyltransferase family 4 protein [Alphaproteobacteria bacterium]|jgi:glycosyltransferase involved in cell wall biosynthesis|nr:glycosyltransferase family 4 protein [Alphaproteobacteria bacterium]
MAIRLLFIIQNSDVFVSHRLPIAQRAVAEGYEVHLATHVLRHREMIESKGVKVHHFPLLSTLPFGLREAWACLVLMLIFVRVKPNLLHAVAIRCILLGGLVGRLLRVPHRVFAISGVGYYFIEAKEDRSLFRRIIVWFMRFAINNRQSLTIFQNDEDLELCQSMGIVQSRPNVMIRGSGVNLEDFFPLHKKGSDEIVIGLPARIQAHKGVREFAAAAHIVKKQHPAARFVLLGEIDNNNPTALQQSELDAWANEGLVESWGLQTDMPSALRRLDIACLPSYREGLPKALLEAAATGLPIVTTDVPGCRDVIEDGKEGFIVPAKDPQALAEALTELIASVTLRQEMGAAARKRAEQRFSIEKIVDEHFQAYAQVLAVK